MLNRIASVLRPNRRRIALLVPDPHYDRVITRETRARLDSLGEVVRPATTSEALAPLLPGLLAGVDACLTGWGTPPLPISALPPTSRLRLIAHTAGSVRHLIPPEAYARGIQVAHAAPVIADSVAEYTLLLVLEGLRRVAEMDRRMRRALPWGEAGDIYQGDLLSTRHVGIVGAGYVGQRVIRVLKPLAASVSVYDPYLSVADATAMGVKNVPLDRLFAECSIVSVHTPVTQETHNMIGAKQLASLPDGAIFVNTARAWAVDQAAMMVELEKGRIWAALDVFDPEPVPSDSPLLKMENVILTPHVAGRSLTTLRRQGEAMVEEIERWTRGEALRYQVTEAMLPTMA